MLQCIADIDIMAHGDWIKKAVWMDVSDRFSAVEIVDTGEMIQLITSAQKCRLCILVPLGWSFDALCKLG